MNIPTTPAEMPSIPTPDSALQLGVESKSVSQLKRVLYMAGYWDSAEFGTIVTGELLYWIAQHQRKDCTGDSIEFLIGQVTSRLELMTGIDLNVTRHLAVSAPVKEDPMFIAGVLNKDYLVPDFVVRNPEKVYGSVDGVKLEIVQLPFPLIASWDKSLKLTKLRVNADIADDFIAAMLEVLETFGPDGVHAHGIDVTGGCYNKRKIRGGTRWSSHSWGASIDYNPIGNAMRMNPKQTLFGRFDSWRVFGEIMYKHGFRTLAHDMMHWQHVPKNYR